MISKTPRTDKMFDIWSVAPEALEFTKYLECELTEAQELIVELRKQLAEKIAECLRIKSNVQREYCDK